MILLRTKRQLTILAHALGDDCEIYFELSNDGSAQVNLDDARLCTLTPDDVATLRHFLDNFKPAVE